jgi:peroxiredoxin
MERDGKILSAIAAGMLVVAIGMVAWANYGKSGDSGSAAAIIGVPAGPLRGDPVAAGKVAANFKLRDLKGSTISLSSLRGKVVFLNVWATWCPPCREEMPSIETLYEEFRNNPNFVVLAVSQDSEGRSAVDSYVHRHGFKFTVLLDPRNEVGDAYDVSGIPETFIIDQAGRIVAHHLGPYDWAQPDMRQALRDLIDNKDEQTARAE